ncbi:AN1-type zinc finger protein 4-like [Daktulosphaira vitifoliae]|uniref:AN1-type zinc finger protein 4-like n=1 Tax=Daktulosphaira vitifoliae TaxID=58002 RepID=UPI0021A9F576|nr:AN1-type zinc finger protein 4-like [Daktulosphaira vitifoliae]
MSRKQKWRSKSEDSFEDIPISLTIETLTGTAFEISVSPSDYVSSLKARIQRVEGIPVNQQHLLSGEKILSDNTTIAYNNLYNGATLRLVLSLQGGPIGTSRRMLPLDNETIKQLVDLNRKEILEDAPPGSKLAVLIFREGEVINLLRVIENNDGSITNLMESPRKISTEQTEKKKCKQSVDNNVTYRKMMQLKHKLESLSISSKSKLKKTKPENRKSITTSDRSQLNTEKDNSKRHTWRLPKIVQPSTGLEKYVHSAEFSRIPVLPTIASACSEKSTKTSTTRQICHLMNDPRHTGSTSSIDSISESGTDVEVSSADWSRRPSTSSLLLSHNIHINVSRQTSPTEQMATMSLTNNTGLGAIHRILNRSDMPIQLDDNDEPMGTEHKNEEKPTSIAVVKDLSNTTTETQTVEKKKKRCAQCNKKLTISAQYTCRCGLIFCPEHRYSESHNCSYDYQKNGRDSIEKNNPLVVRPKLPKI